MTEESVGLMSTGWWRVLTALTGAMGSWSNLTASAAEMEPTTDLVGGAAVVLKSKHNNSQG